MDLLNINHLSEKFREENAAGLVTQSLGAAAGSQRIYVNIDTVPPKAYSTKFHSHSQQEEFFLIVGGCGTLRINEEAYPIKKGDFLSKLPGREIAHTFYNSSGEPLIILDIGTVEKEDTCFYPDEGIYLYKSNGINRAYEKRAMVEGWTSDPNS